MSASESTQTEGIDIYKYQTYQDVVKIMNEKFNSRGIR
jgi:hypothetical protein